MLPWGSISNVSSYYKWQCVRDMGNGRTDVSSLAAGNGNTRRVYTFCVITSTGIEWIITERAFSLGDDGTQACAAEVERDGSVSRRKREMRCEITLILKSRKQRTRKRNSQNTSQMVLRCRCFCAEMAS